MFHSMELLKAIHDDRVREIERTIRDRRLMHPDQAEDEVTTPVNERITAAPVIRGPGSVARSGSACEPA
jgi:hypothetical protein